MGNFQDKNFNNIFSNDDTERGREQAVARRGMLSSIFKYKNNRYYVLVS